MDEKGGEVVSIGKIADIYANVGITKKVKATGIDALTRPDRNGKGRRQHHRVHQLRGLRLLWPPPRRGYAAALELFDRRLPELLKLVKDETSSSPPTTAATRLPGTDHTREHIPVLVYGPKVKPGPLGHRETFADIGQTVANYFGLSPMDYGKMF